MKRATIWRLFAGLLAVAFWLLGAQALGLTRRSTNIIAGTGISVGAVDNTTTGQQDWTISSTVTGGVTSVTGSSGVSCSPTSGAVTCSSTLTLPTVASGTGITVTGGPAYTVALTTPVAAANGGTGQTALAAHNVLLGEGTAAVGLASPSTSGQPLLSTGGSSDPSFGPLSLSGAGVTSVLGVANGGTGASSFTSGSLLLGNGTGALSLLAPGSAGNVPQSNGLGAWTANQFHTILSGVIASGYWSGTSSLVNTSIINDGQITLTTGTSVTILACLSANSSDNINNELHFGIGLNSSSAYASGAQMTANVLSSTTAGGTSFVNVCNIFPLTGLTGGSNQFFLLANVDVTPTVSFPTAVGAKGIVIY